jgi:hypothetical protein
VDFNKNHLTPGSPRKSKEAITINDDCPNLEHQHYWTFGKITGRTSGVV